MVSLKSADGLFAPVQCLAKVTDLNRTIHRIPAAKVKEGSSTLEPIHEGMSVKSQRCSRTDDSFTTGEQVAIVFSFEGEPPFALWVDVKRVSHGPSSFMGRSTYVRSVPTGKKGAMRVQETKVRANNLDGES